MSVPDLIAKLNAAPADGDEVIVAATSLLADAFTSEDISLATDDATNVRVTVRDTDVSVVGLPTSLIDGRRLLPLRLSSPGAYVVLDGVAETSEMSLQRTCHDPIFALVAATHLPLVWIEPTRLMQP